MQVFVSYNFQDEAIFSAIALALESAHIDRWDSSNMQVGEPLAGQLRSAIEHCELCIFVATRRSIASQWCLAELGAFWGTGKRVLIYMADPDIAEGSLPPQFNGTLQVSNARVLIEATQRSFAASKPNIATPYEFYRTCGEYGSEAQWSELLDQAKEHFFAMGVSLSAWRRMPQFDRRATNKAASDCQIRFLLMHPENPLLEGTLYKGRDLASVQSVIEESVQYFRCLQQEHENIEFRLMKSGLPHFSVVRADSRIVLTQYIASETWGSGPTWRCKEGSPLFDVALTDYELLWNGSVRAA